MSPTMTSSQAKKETLHDKRARTETQASTDTSHTGTGRHLKPTDSADGHLIDQDVQEQRTAHSGGHMEPSSSTDPSYEQNLRKDIQDTLRAQTDERSKQPPSLLSRLVTYWEMTFAVTSGILIAIAWFLMVRQQDIFSVPLFIAAYVIGGYAKAREGLMLLIHEKKLGVDVLMILAALAAASIGYWTEGAILIFIFAMSGALESYTMAKSRKDLSALMSIRPDEATILKDGEEKVVPTSDLQIGDIVLVRPGDTIPIDGRIIEGSSSVNQATITGESVPVDKTVGDTVFAGTQNEQGALKIEVTERSGDTLFAKIVKLVSEAENTMPKSQQFIERFESIYTYIVLATTALLMTVPIFFFHVPASAALYRAIVFMVVASPCAVVASITPAILAAMSNGARRGLLFKGGTHLETLAKTRVVAFDKTGTITSGKPVVTDIVPREGLTVEDFLTMAASAEHLSEHPIARAIVQKARELNLPLRSLSNLEASLGRGITVQVDGSTWRIGSRTFIGIAEGSTWESLVDRFENEGKTVIFMRIDDDIQGAIALKDTIREEARATIQALHSMGIKVAMLTGDHERPAQAIAKEVGVDLVYANLLPQDKADMIKSLREQYEYVAMVGDGVNDAPALALASVGVAMGAQGSDVALETADVILMNDQLDRLPFAIRLGRRSQRVIKQNLSFALGVILLLISVNFGVYLPLPLGVVGHEGSTILVILNGLRLLRNG